MDFPTFRPRPARAADLRSAMRLLEPDRDLFSATVWKQMRGVLTSLLEAGRVSSIVIEDTASGALCFCGIAAFARPRAVERAAATGMRETLLRQANNGEPVLLSRKQVAAANAGGDLALVHLFGCPDSSDFTQPRTFELIRLAFEAFAFQHAGHQLREIWQEAVVPQAVAFVATMGMPEVRRWELASGRTAHQFRFTLDDALQNPGNPLTHLMRFPKPKLRLTIGEQRLAELALMDVPDAAIAVELGVSADAVKKRWRGLYTRVRREAPSLIPEDASGPAQRRALLAYLRQHLEELRPYRRS